MFRFIDLHLKEWAQSKVRKPLLLRGARQVGKTFAVRKLGATFERYVEVNFEEQPHLKKIFDQDSDLNPERMIRDLSLALGTEILPGKTLLFFDESQAIPRVIIALRYFYEEMPELHVIAAGSLLDFAIEKVGVPVGRIGFYHLYPMSFLEFLKATGHELILKAILNHDIHESQNEVVHDKILGILREYLAIGGMPEVVQSWTTTKDPMVCAKIHHEIIYAYRQDFGKYARDRQIKYVELIFDAAARQLGKKFKFSELEGDYRKRELAPALDLLVKAGVLHRIYQSSGQGIPIGATANYDKYKLMLLDVGLTQALLGLDLADWFLNKKTVFVNKGAIMESFVGQELRAYLEPSVDNSLYYWQRDVKGSEAEVDYLIQLQGKIIPIEVKGDKGRQLKSMHLFLDSHPDTPFGIRFSAHNYSVHQKIHSYPLYAIASGIHWKSPESKK
jgi:predicted AAA+ superfamily ATPase